MCFGQPQTLKSGARVTTGTTTETRTGPRGKEYQQTLRVPLAKTLDTTGATSASEAFGSKEATDKWFARSPSRPMTEAEYNEYRASPQYQQSQRQAMIHGASAFAKQGTYVGQGGKRVPMQSSLLIAPRTYDEYMTRASEATSRTRTQVGGGTRATGLNV